MPITKSTALVRLSGLKQAGWGYMSGTRKGRLTSTTFSTRTRSRKRVWERKERVGGGERCHLDSSRESADRKTFRRVDGAIPS